MSQLERDSKLDPFERRRYGLAGRRIRTSITQALAVLALLSGAAPMFAATGDLTSLSVDDLMNVEVTSVSRKGQKLSDTAAAVFVITQDDIQRSGATSIPEILRIVPGLDVARINGNTWAITARGFNGRFANKLLVLIDGRSVYTPLFSGVYWDAQDTLLEDIDRIEVIRGPGGTLWGANAVNGIIDIITKHAIETQGTLLTAGAGSSDGLSGGGRFGGKAGQNGFYRIYGKSFDRPPSIGGANPTHDAWTMGQAGFRADWTSRRGDNFTMQGDVYRGSVTTVNGLLNPDDPGADRSTLNHLSGEDLQFRWEALQSSRSDTTLQIFYDSTARPDRFQGVRARTLDLDFQHHLKLGGGNDLVWGAQYRISHDEAAGTGLQLLRPSDRTLIAGAFIQDELQLSPRLRVTAGTKIEYDDVSRIQWQPTLRALFKWNDQNTFWAAATSAIRTPSEIERYGVLTAGTVPTGPDSVGLITVFGNENLKSERVTTYELGYRWQTTPELAFDATIFRNEINDLVGTTALTPYVDPRGRVIIPISYANNQHGESRGGEILVTDALAPNWKVAAGYSYFELATEQDGTKQTSTGTGNNVTPRHQLQLRSSLQMTHDFELDAAAYYVGRMEGDARSYIRLDLQAVWRPSRQWELSVSGQNLAHRNDTEFLGGVGESEIATPVQRSVNGKVTWRF